MISRHTKHTITKQKNRREKSRLLLLILTKLIDVMGVCKVLIFSPTHIITVIIFPSRYDLPIHIFLV